MRTIQQEWQEFLDILYSRAAQRFRATPQYRPLQEKADRLEKQAQADASQLDGFLEALAELNGEESCFLYAQGHRDCLALLHLFANGSEA